MNLESVYEGGGKLDIGIISTVFATLVGGVIGAGGSYLGARTITKREVEVNTEALVKQMAYSVKVYEEVFALKVSPRKLKYAIYDTNWREQIVKGSFISEEIEIIIEWFLTMEGFQRYMRAQNELGESNFVHAKLGIYEDLKNEIMCICKNNRKGKSRYEKLKSKMSLVK